MKTFSNQTKSWKLRTFFVVPIFILSICFFPSGTYAKQSLGDVPMVKIDKTIVKEIQGQTLSFRFTQIDGVTSFNAMIDCNFEICECLKIKGKVVLSTNFSEMNIQYTILGKTLRLRRMGIEISNV